MSYVREESPDRLCRTIEFLFSTTIPLSRGGGRTWDLKKQSHGRGTGAATEFGVIKGSLDRNQTRVEGLGRRRKVFYSVWFPYPRKMDLQQVPTSHVPRDPSQRGLVLTPYRSQTSQDRTTEQMEPESIGL